jgi:hypothetical protein
VSDLGRIKGVAFGEFVDWYAAARDTVEVERAVERVSPQFPDVFDLARPNYGILASHWYDARVVHALLDELTAGKPEEELERMAAEAAAAIMGKTIRGVYKAVFSIMVSPARYAKHIDKLWGLHYDSGTPVVELVGPKQHRVHYTGWRSHHPMICRLNRAAGPAIYGAMGCKDVVSRRVGCVSEGAARCESLITWR